MSEKPTLFIFVTAAGMSRHADQLIRGSIEAGWTTYTVETPNLSLVVAPERIFDIPGNHWIRGYEQPPLDVFPFGTMLVAPCTFNTLNKLAHGIADNLATSMVADALGAGCPVFIAPAMNYGLWNHPQTRESLKRLASWGCHIFPPEVAGTQVTMAPFSEILARLREHFNGS